MNTTVPRIKSILISCLLLAFCIFLAGRLEAGAVGIPAVGAAGDTAYVPVHEEGGFPKDGITHP